MRIAFYNLQNTIVAQLFQHILYMACEEDTKTDLRKKQTYPLIILLVFQTYCIIDILMFIPAQVAPRTVTLHPSLSLWLGSGWVSQKSHMCTCVIGKEDDILNKLSPNPSRWGQHLIGKLGTLREMALWNVRSNKKIIIHWFPDKGKCAPRSQGLDAKSVAATN